MVSDVVLGALRIGFLAGLWLFVLLVANVIRTDLAPRTVAAGAGVARTGDAGQTPAQPKRRGRREPRVLAIVSGAQAGQRLLLVDRFSIGRTDRSELQLDDDYVSTTHAELHRGADGRWIVSDLGSTNGTFVNEQRVTAPTELGLADTLRIGRTQMKLET